MNQLQAAGQGSSAGTHQLADQACRRPRPQASGAIIAVVNEQKNAYSQTFVHDHVHWLPCSTRFLYGKQTDSLRTEAGRQLASLPERLLIAVLRVFGIRVQALEDRGFRRFVRRERVSAVLAEFGPMGVALKDACRAADVPLVVHFHGYDAFGARWLSEFGSAYRETFAMASAVIGVSNDMVRQLISLGAAPKKVFHISCGVDTARFSPVDPANAPPTFLAVGRFVDKKAPMFTLAAFHQVVRRCPEARLVMIGDGPLMEMSMRLAKLWGIVSSVDFRGPRPHSEVLTIMRTVRAYVQHSITTSDGNSEGTPVSVLEAAASGLPIIATSHAGITEAVIHEHSGFLVQEEDIDQMAEFMVKLASDSLLAARLGERGRDHVLANYSIDSQTERLMRVIEASISKKGKFRRPS